MIAPVHTPLPIEAPATNAPLPDVVVEDVASILAEILLDAVEAEDTAAREEAPA